MGNFPFLQNVAVFPSPFVAPFAIPQRSCGEQLQILQELKAIGFQISLVLTDSLYGESGDVIGTLEKLGLGFIVAIRSNHGVWVPPGQRIRYNSWKPYQQKLSHRQPESRLIA